MAQSRVGGAPVAMHVVIRSHPSTKGVGVGGVVSDVNPSQPALEGSALQNDVTWAAHL